MEEKITVELTIQEVRDVVRGLSMYISKKSAPSKYRHRQERLTRLRKLYSEQKNLDAVCLAANGGKLELLSGESGRLRNAINNMLLNVEFVEQRIERVKALREELLNKLPKTDEVTEQQPEQEE